MNCVLQEAARGMQTEFSSLMSEPQSSMIPCLFLHAINDRLSSMQISSQSHYVTNSWKNTNEKCDVYEPIFVDPPAIARLFLYLQDRDYGIGR